MGVLKKKGMMGKLRQLFVQLLIFFGSPPWDKGLKLQIANKIRPVFGLLCKSSLGPLFNYEVQYHAEDAGFTAPDKHHTCWTTDPKKGCAKHKKIQAKKGKKYKINELAIEGDVFIDRLLKAKNPKALFGDIFSSIGAKEPKQTKVPVFDVTNCSGEKAVTCKEKTISITRASTVSDTIFALTTCYKKGGCRTNVNVKGTLKPYTIAHGALLCFTKVDMAIGFCNTCCCKGGMIQNRNSATLLHTTPGYGCSRVHQIMDWMSSAALAMFRVKKTMDILGMNRALISGNGCLD